MEPYGDKRDIRQDAAVAAAVVVLEEFFPQCPNGIASGIFERLCEIIEAAMQAEGSARWSAVNEPSVN